jgi:protein-S-isoprenylcysteine O-methyltransferase Ste14
MYFLLLKLVTKEEIYLKQVFGSEYVDYKNAVPCIWPFGCLKQSNKY